MYKTVPERTFASSAVYAQRSLISTRWASALKEAKAVRCGRFHFFVFVFCFGSWFFVSLSAEGSLCYDRTQIFAVVSVGDIFGALINSFVLLILHKRFGPLSASDCSNSPRD